MAQVRQVKLGTDYYDLDNRFITLTATSGTLTTDQLAVLQASDQNYIVYGDGIFRLVYATSSELWYQRFLSASATNGWIKVTISSRAFAYTTEQFVTSAFKNVAVGSTTIAADSNQDTLTLVAGSNVTLTPDATNDKVTIAATDTTYTAGTGLSLSSGKFNHSNSVTAGTAGTSSATSGSTLAVPYVTYDAQGHVTASGTHTHAVTGFLTSHQTIKQDGVTGATVNRFGTCSTAAATAAKTVAITTGTFALEAGAQVAVKFSNANTANSPTLNVGSTGAKNIFVNGAQITSGGNKALLAGTVIFIYDGTQYHLIGNYYDTNTSAVTGVKGNSEESYRTGNVNLTAANIGAATSGHTHTTTIAAGGTSTVNLAANTAYTLTAGGTSVVFKTPPDNNSVTGVKGNSESSYRTGQVNLTAANIGAAAESHTHNYAGSSSAGGAATSANKLNTDAGDYLTPVYFDNGIPVESAGTAIPFIVGTGSTAGTWLGSLDGLTAYTDGLLILYKPSVAGASTTTLNINSLGAKTVYRNSTTKLTTHYPANQPILLVYSTSQNSGCWMAIDDYPGDSDTVPQVQMNTAAATAAKAGACTYFTAKAKSYVMVNIRYANTAASAITLNVNGTGAKPIYINGAASSSSNHTLPAGSYFVYYDGTNYYFRTDEILPAKIDIDDVSGTTTASAVTSTTFNTVVTGGTTTNVPNVTAVGSVPSLSYTARTVGSASGWSAGTAASASYANGILTITNGTAPSLTITSTACDDITAWSAGSVPTLGTAIKAYTGLTTGASGSSSSTSGFVKTT